ncbi:MAG TPA: hypothetical protein VFE60_16745 [Roseiarcus sp.]|jgi:hypothetical protein|nr:hypothetical protein [Roseiarcus sp.]
MTKFVSYVPDEAIEKDAQALLAEYAHARGVTIEVPIAIDDIIEKHLKIGIEFDDTHRLFGVPRSGIGFDPDILGAIFFEQKRIVIDESLDPDANPAKEGRYRYTAAHEVGHWRLHRGLFGKDPAQTSLLDANTRSGARKFREALRREVPRFADRHAHPARKARAAAPRCAASSASVRWRVSPFFEEVVKCQLNKRSERSPTGPCSKRAISISPASCAAPATNF